MTGTRVSYSPGTAELRELSALPAEAALRRASDLLAKLVEDPAFMEHEVLPRVEEAEGAGGWYVARRFEGDAYSLQVFVWPPGTGTKVHDHASWGVYRCAWGAVLEERYERLDDGSRPEHARLKKAWQLAWNPEDGASTVLPGDGGIHRVSNPGGEVSVTVHLYGPRTGEVEGRDYDPSRDHVCDRPA